VTQFHEEWNCAPASNVAAKRIFGERCRSQAVGTKRDWGKGEFRSAQHRSGKKREKERSKRDKCQVFRRRVATTATASFANAEELNCAAIKKQLLQSRISIVANIKSAWI